MNLDEDEVMDNITHGTMDNSSFSFQPRDIFLPTDCSGYVYVLIILHTQDLIYIGKTKDLYQRM